MKCFLLCLIIWRNNNQVFENSIKSQRLPYKSLKHTLVKPNDLSQMNAAFFTTNGFVSVILFATFGGAVFIAKYF
ncbi:MAG: hypothetical protein K1X72_06565 [Pyrinomonadaceae bacterium]|nr:hypothetical protein [Pyrinomonadaceae bacterium]